MTNVTDVSIELTETQLQQLEQQAQHKGVSVEALIQNMLQLAIDARTKRVQAANDHVLNKNHELYERLS